MRKIATNVTATENCTNAEIAISGFLTVVLVEQVAKNPDEYEIVLDDRLKGTKTEIPFDCMGSFTEAVAAAGRALLQAAQDAKLDDMDGVLASEMAKSFERTGSTEV